MNPSFRLVFLLLSLVALASRPSALGSSNVIYSGLKDISIPTDFNGVYLNLDNGATGTSSIAGWDFNPTFGGARVYNSPSFQPARTGSGFEDAILALTAGTFVNGSLTYSSGYGASDTHLGNGAGQFQPGSEAYLGFQFTTDANDGPHFGWMRVVFTSNQPGGLIRDWAYDTGTTGMTSTSIQTGNILQAAPVSGVSVVTLSGTQAATLGSGLSDPRSGVVTAVTKNGTNTWTMSGEKTYTGATTINTGILELGAGGKFSGTSSITVNNGGTLLLSDTGGTNNKLNSAATVTLAGGTIDLGGMTLSLNQTVGALTLTANSILDLGTLLAGNTFKFGASNADWSGVQLAIYNYTGTADHLFFGTDTSGLNGSQLDRIFFYSDAGSDFLGSAQYFDGMGEIVPVPEPAPAFAATVVFGLLVWRERRRFSKRRVVPRRCSR